MMTSLPPAFSVMLRPMGAASYASVGRRILGAMPARGGPITLTTFEGRLISGTVDELFIPPGCEEHCIGTFFVSEG